MKKLLLCAMVMVVTVTATTESVSAQVGRNQDRLGGTPVRERLEAVFLSRVRSELGLSPEVSAKFAAILQETAAERRRLEQTERTLRTQLQGELRPGVAANQTVVTNTLDGLLASRVAFAETYSAEMRRLREILTPVQQGQYFLMRDQLMKRAQEMIEARPGAPVGGRPIGN